MAKGLWLGHPHDPMGRCVGGVWQGIRPDLESEADDLIFAQTRATSVPMEKRDVITPWKALDRASHEVLVGARTRWGRDASPGAQTAEVDGVPDRSVRLGYRHRVLNPLQTYLNGQLCGVRLDRVTPEAGVGPIFGKSLNTPSLWVDGDPRLPLASTGCSAKVKTRRVRPTTK